MMRNKMWRKTAAALAAFALVCTAVPAFGGTLPISGGAGSDVSITGPDSFATPSGDLIALDDQNISIMADDYVKIAQKDGFVYVYTIDEDSIPYVIIGYYDMTDDNFANLFTDYMASSYPDLAVAEGPERVMINNLPFERIVYDYTVSGYKARDTRLFTPWNNVTLMFGSKEVPELGLTLPEGYLEQVAVSYQGLAGGDSDYANHVDSGRSVFGGGPDPFADLMTEDILPPQQNEPEGGTVGQDTGSTEDTNTTEDTTEDTTADGGNVEETPVVEEGSIVFREDAANYAGTWVTFEDGFKLYLPSSWSWYEITDEQKMSGILYQAGDASGNDTAPFITVGWTYSDGLTTVNEIAAELASYGYEVDGIVDINGIRCVTYQLPGQDLSGVMFFHPQSTDYIFAVGGTPYSSNVDTIASILTSLSLT